MGRCSANECAELRLRGAATRISRDAVYRNNRNTAAKSDTASESLFNCYLCRYQLLCSVLVFAAHCARYRNSEGTDFKSVPHGQSRYVPLEILYPPHRLAPSRPQGNTAFNICASRAPASVSCVFLSVSASVA